MKQKNILIASFIVLAIIFLALGITYSLYVKPPIEQEEPKKNYPEEDIVAELKGVVSSDNKIILGKTYIYRWNNISGMLLKITPRDNFDKVYLKIVMKLPKKKDNIIIKLENLVKDVEVEYEVQSLNDWTDVKSWTIEIITEQEAFNAGYVEE